jgi:hypothetical protein
MAVLYNPGIVTDGLVLCLDAANLKSYPGSGVTWSEISNRSNNATLINGATFGFYNNGYIRCDGTNDYIEVLDSSSLDFGANNFTVEYWFRKLQSTSGGYGNIWGPNKWNLGSAPGTNEWTLGIGDGSSGNTNKYEFSIAATTNTIYGIQSSDQLLINTWYQLIGMRDGANLKLFLNGILKINQNPSGMTAGTAVANVERNLRINNSQINNLYTNADSAVCRIYNRALSDTEVLQNFNALRGRFGI